MERADGRLDVEGRPVYSARWAGPAGRPTLVFLHEGLGSVAQWADFPALLCERAGLAGFAYDRLGHGRSAPRAAPRTKEYLREEAGFLSKVLAAAGLDGRLVLVGHSDGGAIALLFAGLHPGRAEALITEAAHVFVDERTISGIRATIAEYERGPLKRLLRRYHGDKTEALFLAWHETWRAPWYRDWTIAAELPKVSAPALVLQGEEDPYESRGQMEAIARGAARAEARLIPRCGHVPHHERRGEVVGLMAGFLKACVEA